MTKRFPSLEGISFCLLQLFWTLGKKKKNPFSSESIIKAVEDRFVKMINTSDPSQNRPSSSASNTEATGNVATPLAPCRKTSLWSRFDVKVQVIAKSSVQKTTGPLIEIRRHLEEAPISRDENPRSWWKEHALLFPKLQDQAKSFVCSPASSVPSERLFSKAGALISRRRSRIKDKNINKILFLNNKMKWNFCIYMPTPPPQTAVIHSSFFKCKFYMKKYALLYVHLGRVKTELMWYYCDINIRNLCFIKKRDIIFTFGNNQCNLNYLINI